MNKCVYCDNILRDENIRLVKNDIYTDIINVRRFYKIGGEQRKIKNFEREKEKEKEKEIEKVEKLETEKHMNFAKEMQNEKEKEKEMEEERMKSPLLLMNNVEIDNKYIILKNGEINKCRKLFTYYNCYDYIILNNPYSFASINLIILFKGIMYDMKNLKRKHLSCILHVYNYINCIIDVFLFYLLIGKGKTVHYKQMFKKSNQQKNEFPDSNEEIIEIISRLNQVINKRKQDIRTKTHSKDTTTYGTNPQNNNDIYPSSAPNIYQHQYQYQEQKQQEQEQEQVNESNIIEQMNTHYENIYKDIFKKTKDPVLSEFYRKLENVNIKKKITILKKHLYIGCAYPSPINHFSIQVLFPPFANFNFFTFPFYFPIRRILYHLYLYGHVKNYSSSDIMKNIYGDVLLRQLKESDIRVRELLQF